MPNQRGQCCHNHDCNEIDCGAAYSLYKHVDLDNVMCLNELQVGSCRRIFRPWSQRVDTSNGSLKSNDDDCELLLQIPFKGSVHLKAITVIGGTDGSSPSKVRAFVNRTNLDFQSIESILPQQEWDLQEDFQGLIEYPAAPTKFKGVYFLTLHFPETFGASQMEISFLGLKGDYIERRKEAVVAVYESKPMPEDHQVPGSEQQNFWRMGM